MLKPEELRKGNLIQYDHDERRKPPVCMQRGFVKEIHSDYVVLSNGEKRKWERTEGLPATDELLVKFGCISFEGRHDLFLKDGVWLRIFKGGVFEIGNQYEHSLFDRKIEFIHQVQNIYDDLTGFKLEITVPEPRPIHPQQ